MEILVRKKEEEKCSKMGTVQSVYPRLHNTLRNNACTSHLGFPPVSNVSFPMHGISVRNQLNAEKPNLAACKHAQSGIKRKMRSLHSGYSSSSVVR